MSLINISAQEWKDAKDFFAKNNNEVKFSKKETNRNAKTAHSFIKVEGEIFAIANQQIEEERKYAPLGEGGTGKVKVVQTEAGQNFSVKIEGEISVSKRKLELDIMKKVGFLKGSMVRQLPAKKAFKQEETNIKNYTVAQLREGADLFEQLFIPVDGLNYEKRKDITQEQKLNIALKCCKAIQVLHEKGIIHCDIKPENFIAKIEGNNIAIEAIDYSDALLLEKGENALADKILRGTEGYVAPEIDPEKRIAAMLGNNSNESSDFDAIYSFASDIYSLGVLFDTVLDLTHYPMLEKLIQQMLEEDRTKRPQMKIIIKTLQQACDYIPLVKWNNAHDKSEVEAELARIQDFSFQELKIYAKKLMVATTAFEKNPINLFSIKGKGFFPVAVLQLLLEKAGFPSNIFINETSGKLAAVNQKYVELDSSTIPGRGLNSAEQAILDKSIHGLTSALKNEVIKEFCLSFKEILPALTVMAPITTDPIAQSNYVMTLFNSLCVLPLAVNENIRKADTEKLFTKLFKVNRSNSAAATDNIFLLNPVKNMIFPQVAEEKNNGLKTPDNKLIFSERKPDKLMPLLKSLTSDSLYPDGLNIINIAHSNHKDKSVKEFFTRTFNFGKKKTKKDKPSIAVSEIAAPQSKVFLDPRMSLPAGFKFSDEEERISEKSTRPTL